jgi:hypothetical protein
MNSLVVKLIPIMLGLALGGCCKKEDACVKGTTQKCVCPGSGEGAQTCDGTGWGTCECGASKEKTGSDDSKTGSNDTKGSTPDAPKAAATVAAKQNVPSCSTDAQCGPGKQCKLVAGSVPARWSCIPKPTAAGSGGCRSNSDCRPGYVCRADSNSNTSCVKLSVNTTCSTDAQCAPKKCKHIGNNQYACR